MRLRGQGHSWSTSSHGAGGGGKDLLGASEGCSPVTPHPRLGPPDRMNVLQAAQCLALLLQQPRALGQAHLVYTDIRARFLDRCTRLHTALSEKYGTFL